MNYAVLEVEIVHIDRLIRQVSTTHRTMQKSRCCVPCQYRTSNTALQANATAYLVPPQLSVQTALHDRRVRETQRKHALAAAHTICQNRILRRRLIGNSRSRISYALAKANIADKVHRRSRKLQMPRRMDVVDELGRCHPGCVVAGTTLRKVSGSLLPKVGSAIGTVL